MLDKKITSQKRKVFIMGIAILLLFSLTTPVMAQGGGERWRSEPTFLMPLIQYHRNTNSSDISSTDRNRRAPDSLASRPSPEQANLIERDFINAMQNGTNSADAHEAARKLMEFAGVNDKGAMLEIARLFANSTESIDRATSGLAIFVAESITAFVYSSNLDN